MKLDEQARDLKRSHIVEAAERCFLRRGFHQTTMQDICREASMSPGNLYRYFDSKEAVIEAFAKQELHWLTTAISDLSSSKDMLQAILDTFFWSATTVSVDGKAELTAELFAESGRNPRIRAIYVEFSKGLTEAICASLREATATGSIAPVHDLPTLARIIVSLVNGLTMRQIVDPELDMLKMRAALEESIRALLGVRA